MDIKSIKIACFSPPKTMEKILYGIAKGIRSPIAKQVNLTYSGSITGYDDESHDETDN